MTHIFRIVTIATSLAMAACDSPVEVPGSANPGGEQPGGNPPALPPVIGSVSIGGYTLPLVAGDTAQLTVRAWSPAGVELAVPVAWSSADTALVSVSESGLLSARAGGMATISVDVGGHRTDVPLSIRNRPPALESLLPAKVPVGSAGFTLAVRGKDFVQGARVMWWKTPLETVRMSDAELRAEVPAALVAYWGGAPISVVNPLADRPSASADFIVERAPAVEVRYDLVGLESGVMLPVETQRGSYRHWQSGAEYAEVLRHVTRGSLTLTHRAHEESSWLLSYTERVSDAAGGAIVEEVEYHAFGLVTRDPLDGSVRFVDGSIPRAFGGRFIGEFSLVMEKSLGGGVKAWMYSRQ
jgi:hypothetical protein